MPFLYLDGAANSVDHAAELNEGSVTRSLHDPTMVHGNSWVYQITPQCAQPCQNTILVGTCKTAVADNISSQDRRKFSLFTHRGPLDNPSTEARPRGFPGCPAGDTILAIIGAVFSKREAGSRKRVANPDTILP
jgi:hypothetical protein